MIIDEPGAESGAAPSHNNLKSIEISRTRTHHGQFPGEGGVKGLREEEGMNRLKVLLVMALASLVALAGFGTMALASEALPDQAKKPRAAKKAIVPPPPLESPKELYDRGSLLDTSFPKYFTFLADGRGLGETGAVRIKVKRRDAATGALISNLYEVRDVGEIIASDEHAPMIYGDGADKAYYGGKLLLSTNDQVMIRCTEDLAKILDSDTYGDSDPYFREFPIYGQSYNAREPMRSRVDRGQSVGELYEYKGTLKIVARVEGLAPIPPKSATALKRERRLDKSQDAEPVTYVASITYSVDAVSLNDRIFVFVPLDPGPERVLDPPFVEQPDSYVSLGN